MQALAAGYCSCTRVSIEHTVL